jgi:hypothetical protein
MTRLSVTAKLAVPPEPAARLQKLWKAFPIGLDGDLQAAAEAEAQRAHKGQPPDLASQEIATTAAYAFLALAGKRPTVITRNGTARGPFVDLVAELFQIARIDASPRSFAKVAVAAVKASLLQRLCLLLAKADVDRTRADQAEIRALARMLGRLSRDDRRRCPSFPPGYAEK